MANKPQIRFDKEDFNDVYLPYIDNPSRFLLFYGGGGSGKSQFVAQRYIYRCLKQDYFRLLYCRKVARTIRNSQFQLFKDLISKWGMDELFDIKEATMEITCANGNMLIPSGMDDREKIKSIQEPTDAWCEEATEFDKEDLMQLNLRLRTSKAPFNQIVMTFNPVSDLHWINESFFIHKEFECDILKTTYLDNRFIDPEYKKQMDSLIKQDENYYKVYALGEWGGVPKGLIFKNWRLTDHVPKFAETFYGLDFGFNNPTALIRCHVADKVNVWVEQVLYKTGLTNSDLIEEMKRLGVTGVIYADSAEPQRIEEMYRAGFNVKPADKGKDSIRRGIDFIKSIDIQILDHSSDLIKEIRAYKWEEDKNGKFIDGKPVKFMDHAMDAMRYAIHGHLSKPTGSFGVRIV